jgi:hypothetical protein
MKLDADAGAKLDPKVFDVFSRLIGGRLAA